MQDYNKLIENLKTHSRCFTYEDDCAYCDGIEDEKSVCSLSMHLIKQSADAIEQLVKERDAFKSALEIEKYRHNVTFQERDAAVKCIEERGRLGMSLINKKEVIETLLTTENVEDIFLDLAYERRLDYSHGVEELDVVDFARDIVKAVIGVIDTSPTVDAVEFDALESWLYEIAMNNTGNYLCDACEEIITRLDGLKAFVKDKRGE